MGLLSDYLKIFTPAALAAGMALSPDEAEAMYVGPKAKGWEKLTNKFSGLMDRMERAEISDAGAKVNTSSYLKYPGNVYQTKDAAVLSDIFEHPELYAQYPHLRNISIESRFGQKGTPSGSFNENFNRIRAQSENPEDLKDTLLHEIQHAIQEKEGWARGGRPEQFYKLHSRYKELFDEIGRHESRIANEISKYQSKWGNDFKNYSTKDEFDLNGFIAKEKDSIERIRAKLKIEGLLENMRNEEPGNLYKRLAGEVESRDTAARMGMDLSERQRTLPYASQNVPLKDVITKFGMGGAALGPMLYSPEAAQARQYQNMAASQALQEPTFDPTTLLAGPARWGGGLLNMGLDTLMRYMAR